MKSCSQIMSDAVTGVTASDGHSLSCDVETFCEPCLEVVHSLSKTDVKVHDTLQDVLNCGKKKCTFCRYIYTPFAEEIREDLPHQKRVPQMGMCTYGYESETRLVQKMKMEVYIRDWGWKKDNFTPQRYGGPWRGFKARANEARGLNRAIWSHPGPLNFSVRKDTILEWLEECQTNHPKCKNVLGAQTSAAARMLEVISENGQLHVRLVSSTQGSSLNCSPYFVLTHCWGGVEIEAKLTAEKVEAYHQNIDVSTLPKTFREALEITNTLRCRYLWIDCLCIIQGDADDWAKESMKMAAIFKGALMTISASGASNSSEGCGISNSIAPAKLFTVNRRTEGRPAKFFAIREGVQGERDENNLIRLFRSSPTMRRAWIFQEKILSRRILHTTQSQLFWQCATKIESEDGILDTTLKVCSVWEEDVLHTHVIDHLVQPKSYRDNPRLWWWPWVHEYQRRNLTQSTDRYAAFAGVTEHYRGLTNDKPVFGLWDRDLHIHLAWYAYWDDRKPLTPPAEPRHPSWTWLNFPHGDVCVTGSLSGSLGMTADQRRSEMKYRYEAKVHSCDIEWTERPLVSKPAHGTIKLHGLFDHILLPRNRFGKIGSLDPDFLSEISNESEIYDEKFDVIVLYAYEQQATLKTNLNILISVGLVLKMVNAKKRMYRRIGYVEIKTSIQPEIEMEKLLPGTPRDILLV